MGTTHDQGIGLSEYARRPAVGGPNRNLFHLPNKCWLSIGVQFPPSSACPRLLPRGALVQSSAPDGENG